MILDFFILNKVFLTTKCCTSAVICFIQFHQCVHVLLILDSEEMVCLSCTPINPFSFYVYFSVIFFKPVFPVLLNGLGKPSLECEKKLLSRRFYWDFFFKDIKKNSVVYEGGFSFDYHFAFCNISPKVPLDMAQLVYVFLVIMKCLLVRQFAGGEKQYFLCRHVDVDTYTLCNAHRWELMREYLHTLKLWSYHFLLHCLRAAREW